MTDNDYTHVTLVVDRSGSMSSVQDDAEGGINALLRSQRKQPGKLTVTLTQFDDEFNTVYRLTSKPGKYELEPRGTTALLDAVGKEIDATGRDLDQLPEWERPGRVLFVVVTDGQENASSDYSLDRVRDMVEHQRHTYNWQFQFIGADDNAWQGHSIGMAATSYANTGTGTRAAYQAMNDAVTNYRSAAPHVAAFAMPESVPDPGTADIVTVPVNDLNVIREWARANGFKVSDRGRIPTKVLDAYHAAGN